MNLHNLLLTGSLSGLISILTHAVFWSALQSLRGTVPDSAPALRISEALLHMLCGIGLALLFWMSWGLAAIVAVPWWVRGLSFAGLCWITLVLPNAISVVLTRTQPLTAAATLALRWATTCLIAGLACAWHWDNGVL